MTTTVKSTEIRHISDGRLALYLDSVAEFADEADASRVRYADRRDMYLDGLPVDGMRLP